MGKHSSQDSRSRDGSSSPGRSVSEVLGKVLEPALARRTGMRLDLLQAWSELVGSEFADLTRPEKIDWPRRAHEEDAFRPATLVVACDSAAALFLQHSQKEIVDRVNLFFGFEAVARIRIVQKPVAQPSSEAPRPATRLSPGKERYLQDSVREIDDPKLRETVLKLGRGILARPG